MHTYKLAVLKFTAGIGLRSSPKRNEKGYISADENALKLAVPACEMGMRVSHMI